MSNIDKKALRLTAEKAKDNFMPNFMVPTQDVLALLDELEAKDAQLQGYRKATPVEINDEMAFAFCRAISDDTVGADEVEDIKTGLRAAFANIVTPQPAPAVEAVPVVPKDIPDSVYEILCQACGGGDKACMFAFELWNACRAAMQQPVSNRDELPDGLLKAAAFYRQVERDNPPVETGAWKDAVDWIIREALAAAPRQEVK